MQIFVLYLIDQIYKKKSLEDHGFSAWYSQDIHQRDYEFCLKDRVFILLCKSMKEISWRKKLFQPIITIIERYTFFLILKIPVNNFVNTGIRFHQYWYMISSILVYNFSNTSIRYCYYQYTILSILVYNFINTGIQFH